LQNKHTSKQTFKVHKIQQDIKIKAKPLLNKKSVFFNKSAVLAKSDVHRKLKKSK